MLPGRRLAAAVLLVALAVGLAGCGESASDATSRATGTGGDATAASGYGNGGTTVGDPGPGTAGDPGSTGTTPRYRNPNALAVGDCFDPVNDSVDGSLLAAVIVPCSSSHRHEVFGLPELAGGPSASYPGRDDLDTKARNLCDAAFESYVGVSFDHSGHGYVYYAPVESEWAAGERTIRCAIDDGTMLTGSVKGTRQ